jgi:3-isopropylmalate/(R)-2-methylmalate dehydratase small subunit
MESFTRLTGIAAALMRANIDTDQIIPTRFLTRLSEDGLGEGLFAEWRSRPDGSPDPDFVLNKAPWDRAEILVAGPNFGCGSSREAAPRALRQRGFRALIAAGFGDIFYSNCFRNGIVPVRLDVALVARLGERVLACGAAGCRIAVDLEAQTVSLPADGQTHAFRTPALLRRMLLEGLDEVALTRLQASRIEAFRLQDRARRPWVYVQ